MMAGPDKFFTFFCTKFFKKVLIGLKVVNLVRMSCGLATVILWFIFWYKTISLTQQGLQAVSREW
jgi:hypothetical protein